MSQALCILPVLLLSFLIGSAAVCATKERTVELKVLEPESIKVVENRVVISEGESLEIFDTFKKAKGSQNFILKKSKLPDAWWHWNVSCEFSEVYLTEGFYGTVEQLEK
jgi:hypothetical protein